MDTLLRDQRTRRALSVHEVARRVDVHPASVLRWERGERLPGPVHLHALAGALAVDVSRVASFFDAVRAPARDLAGVRGTGLRALRRDAGLPVRRIAAHLGVHESTVYNWEAGRVRIPDAHLPALARLLATSETRLRERLRSAPAPVATTVAPLRRLRRRTGLSQEAVAQRIGSSRHRVGAWERGEVPPLWAVRRLAGVYGVPASRLAGLVGLAAPRLLDPASWSAGDLPDVLATLRAWSGRTQAEVAQHCGLHRTTVRAWENGRAVPSRRSREALEAAFGLAPGTMLVAYPR